MKGDSEACHRVLANQDILFQLFEENFSPCGLNRVDVARCALVNQAFHKPATRTLWSKLDTVVPLLHLFAPRSLQYPTRCAIDNYNGDLNCLENHINEVSD